MASKSPKVTRRDAQRFRWHLVAPWPDKFDHDAWWKDTIEGVQPAALLWEGLRRLPQAAKLHGPNPKMKTLCHCMIASHGLKSWPELSAGDRGMWRQALEQVPAQRGFDGRMVKDVTGETQCLERGRKACEKKNHRLKKQAWPDPFTLVARPRHRDYFTIQIPRGAANFRQTMEQVESILKSHHKSSVRGRGRSIRGRRNALDVIGEFEDLVLNKPKLSNQQQLARRYREALSRFQFP